MGEIAQIIAPQKETPAFQPHIKAYTNALKELNALDSKSKDYQKIHDQLEKTRDAALNSLNKYSIEDYIKTNPEGCYKRIEEAILFLEQSNPQLGLHKWASDFLFDSFRYLASDSKQVPKVLNYVQKTLEVISKKSPGESGTCAIRLLWMLNKHDKKIYNKVVDDYLKDENKKRYLEDVFRYAKRDPASYAETNPVESTIINTVLNKDKRLTDLFPTNK